MTTTVTLPDDRLHKLMRVLDADTPQEAVEKALERCLIAEGEASGPVRVSPATSGAGSSDSPGGPMPEPDWDKLLALVKPHERAAIEAARAEWPARARDAAAARAAYEEELRRLGPVKTMKDLARHFGKFEHMWSDEELERYRAME